MQIKGRGVRTMIRIGISTRTDFSVKTFDKQGGLESESFRLVIIPVVTSSTPSFARPWCATARHLGHCVWIASLPHHFEWPREPSRYERCGGASARKPGAPSGRPWGSVVRIVFSQCAFSESFCWRRMSSSSERVVALRPVAGGTKAGSSGGRTSGLPPGGMLRRAEDASGVIGESGVSGVSGVRNSLKVL